MRYTVPAPRDAAWRHQPHHHQDAALTESALDLSRLALHKEINAGVLVGQNVEEGVLELAELLVASAGDGDGLALAGGGILFDEVFDVIVVDVVCERVVSVSTEVGSGAQRAGPRR